MRIAPARERLGRASEIERAGRLQIRHQHALFGRQDLRGLAHEAHAGNDQRARRVIATEARHLERVGHATARFQRKVLQLAVHVVVRNQHRIVLRQ